MGKVSETKNAQSNETRSKWIEASAIIIAAIIGAIGGYLIKSTPSEPPSEVIYAINGWNKGTTSILDEWRSFAEQYEEYLAKEYNCPSNKVRDSIKSSNLNIREIQKSIAEDFEVKIHNRLKNEDADPRDINPKIRQFFGEIEVQNINNQILTIDSLTKLGRYLSDQYVSEVQKAFLLGKKPARDSVVQKLASEYLSRRQTISEACIKKLGEWYKHPKSNW